MINPYAIGFVCVAAAFGVGVDYFVQSRASGSQPGEYAFSAYLGGYADRYQQTVASIDKARRQSAAAREHLPEAPEGWVRREWDPTDPDETDILAGMTLIEQMAYKDEKKRARKIARHDAWEYVRGDEVVRLAARYTAPDDADKAMRDAGAILSGARFGNGGPRYEGYAVVQGVPFFRVLGDDAGGALVLEAFIGDGITLGVAARARPETVRALLERVDFESLNLMLDTPLHGIGPDAPRLTPEEEVALAGVHATARYGADRVNAAPAPEEAATAAPEPRGVASDDREAATGVGRRREDGKPKRLQLSGGRSCLGSSGSTFCD